MFFLDTCFVYHSHFTPLVWIFTVKLIFSIEEKFSSSYKYVVDLFYMQIHLNSSQIADEFMMASDDFMMASETLDQVSSKI